MVVNVDQSGRSSRSFIAEGWLDMIAQSILPGGFLFIGSGHNDERGGSLIAPSPAIGAPWPEGAATSGRSRAGNVHPERDLDDLGWGGLWMYGDRVGEGPLPADGSALVARSRARGRCYASNPTGPRKFLGLVGFCLQSATSCRLLPARGKRFRPHRALDVSRASMRAQPRGILR